MSFCSLLLKYADKIGINSFSSAITVEFLCYNFWRRITQTNTCAQLVHLLVMEIL